LRCGAAEINLLKVFWLLRIANILLANAARRHRNLSSQVDLNALRGLLKASMLVFLYLSKFLHESFK